MEKVELGCREGRGEVGLQRRLRYPCIPVSLYPCFLVSLYLCILEFNGYSSLAVLLPITHPLLEYRLQVFLLIYSLVFGLQALLKRGGRTSGRARGVSLHIDSTQNVNVKSIFLNLDPLKHNKQTLI